MTHGADAGRATDDQDDEDRVVSRHVENPTEAEPGDESAYRAADSVPDGDQGGSPGATGGAGAPGASSVDAAEELAAENESEPQRSE